MKITLTISEDDGTNESGYTCNLSGSIVHLPPDAFRFALREAYMQIAGELESALMKRPNLTPFPRLPTMDGYSQRPQ